MYILYYMLFRYLLAANKGYGSAIIVNPRRGSWNKKKPPPPPPPPLRGSLLNTHYYYSDKRMESVEQQQERFLTLPSGYRMPIIGLGTWQAIDEEVESAVAEALRVGYRHVDTAYNYNNEAAIGRALHRWLADSKHKREDLFIVTKLPHVGNRASDVSYFLTKQLNSLQLNYVDLYLIHMPMAFVAAPDGTPAKKEDGSFVLDDTDHVATWKAMEKEVDAGRIRSLGVSNFNTKQLTRIMKEARVPLSCNQVELHAHFQQTELRLDCSTLNVPLTAFSPLGSPGARNHFVKKYNYSPEKFENLLIDPAIIDIGLAYNKKPAQVLLRHLTQQGIAVIPKSTNPERICENFQIFDFKLGEEEMNKINKLDRGEQGRIIDFKFFKGSENHSEYPFPLKSN